MNKFNEGDRVKVKDTGEVGHISQVSKENTYWVQLSNRLNEAKFRADELELIR